MANTTIGNRRERSVSRVRPSIFGIRVTHDAGSTDHRKLNVCEGCLKVGCSLSSVRLRSPPVLHAPLAFRPEGPPRRCGLKLPANSAKTDRDTEGLQLIRCQPSFAPRPAEFYTVPDPPGSLSRCPFTSRRFFVRAVLSAGRSFRASSSRRI